MEGDVGRFEVNAVFNGEPVELLVESGNIGEVNKSDTIRYDTIRYEMLFNVRSKANMSQLNLPHGTDN